MSQRSPSERDRSDRSRSEGRLSESACRGHRVGAVGRVGAGAAVSVVIFCCQYDLQLEVAHAVQVRVHGTRTVGEGEAASGKLIRESATILRVV